MALSHHQHLIVAMSLHHDHDEHLLLFAKDLAKQLDLKIRLVHACETKIGETWLTDRLASTLGRWTRIPWGPRARQGTPGDRSQKEELATRTLREIARRLGLDTNGEPPFDARIHRSPVAALCAASETWHAAMILVGATAEKGLLPWAQRPLYQLMKECKAPILALRRDLSIDPSREGFFLMIADDLTKSSLPGVEVGFQLAQCFKHARLLHIHVGPGDTDQLERRAAAWMPQLEAAGGSYRPLVLKGAVESVLRQVAWQCHADLLIAGIPHEEGDRRKHPVTMEGLLHAPSALMVVPPLLTR